MKRRLSWALAAVGLAAAILVAVSARALLRAPMDAGRLPEVARSGESVRLRPGASPTQPALEKDKANASVPSSRDALKKPSALADLRREAAAPGTVLFTPAPMVQAPEAAKLSAGGYALAARHDQDEWEASAVQHRGLRPHRRQRRSCRRRPTRSRRSRSTSTPPPTPTCAASSTSGQLPPTDAVRIEELVNYFPYDYPQPDGRRAVRGHAPRSAGCPWKPEHRLVPDRPAGRARIDERERCRRATSSSCSTSPARWTTPNKLPLRASGRCGLLVEQLGENDRVAIVVYAGAVGPGAAVRRPATDKATILAALDAAAGRRLDQRRRGHPARLRRGRGRTSSRAASTA